VYRPVEVPRRAVAAVRERLAPAARQSERTLLLGTILLLSAVSAATVFVLTQYYSIDALSSLVYLPQDCFLDWGMQVGRHCFSDYPVIVSVGMRPNPWGSSLPIFLSSYNYQSAPINYLASGMVPHLLFGAPAQWLGAPQLGLFGYLLVLAMAVLAPAVWAARGARGLERVVVFVACGAAAIPVWAAIDRGNSAGFLAPIGLAFLVALCRRRWGLVALMVVLAALVKPQFAVLAVALFAARQWRWGGRAVAGVVISNLAAYLLWPRDFPDTIVQSIRNTLGYGSGSFDSLVGGYNVSFAKRLLLIPDNIAALNAGGKVPEGFLAGPRLLLGYFVLILVVVSVMALGRRIPPVTVGIMLLATASLFPALTSFYYLVFVLPVAALIARDPAGPPGCGIFDRLATLGDRRRAVGICVSLATALSIAQIALPSPPSQAEIPGQLGVTGIIDTTPIVGTTVALAPIAWLIVCAAIIVSYARKPAPPPAEVSARRAEMVPTNTATYAPAAQAG
jgi:Glycosyltransferase family 87